MTLALACGDGDSEPLGAVSQPIMGGYVDDHTSGVVGLGIADHYFAGHCSGTLIAPNLVLTARHCVTLSSLDEDASVVRCGETRFLNSRAPDKLVVSASTERPSAANDPRFVRGASLHPVPGADELCGYDMVLMILERNLTEREARPIVPRIDRPAELNEVFSAAGYGLTSTSPHSPSGIRMRIDENNVACAAGECSRQTDAIRATEWASLDAGVCSGDSGGPALDDEGKVMGVASRGTEGCQDIIYGDVASWRDFIIDTALLAAELGGYEAPFWTSGSSDRPEVPAELPTADAGAEWCETSKCESVALSRRLPAEASCALDAGRRGARSSSSWGLSGLLAFAALLMSRRRL